MTSRSGRSLSRMRAMAQLLSLAALVAAGACLGKRARPVTAPPSVGGGATVPPTRDSTAPDTAGRAPARPNPPAGGIAKGADSAAQKRVADSIAALAKNPAKPAPKKAPTKECILNTNESPLTARFTYQRQTDSSVTLFAGGGFVGRCEGENNRVSADSAEYFQQNGFVNLVGNVTYSEGTQFRVTANHATYFTREGKLYADGNVVATQLKTGSTFRGPNIEYYRVMPNVRTVSRLYAPNNPTVEMIEKDSTGKVLPPVRISASTMEDSGDSLLFAWGNVVIDRTDIKGRSDTASYIKPTGKARLIRGAQITSTAKDQQYTLSGDTIDLFTTDSVLDRVLASHLSRAKSGEMTMSAERIDLRLADRKIQRAFVYGKGRAKADMQQQSLEADSMDIRLPGQRIQELRAHGRAVALQKPDSAKIRTSERDELHGDTVIAVFDTLRLAKDTAARTIVRQITAGGNATSKVQIASRQGPAAKPGINYVRGKHLVVTFDSGQVRTIEVDSSASGVYNEPAPDSVADSSKAAKPPRKPPGRPRLLSLSRESSNARPALPPAKFPEPARVVPAPSAFRRPE